MDKFTEYGRTFQIKTIAALLKNRAFLQQISDILDPKFFDSEANQFIVNTIKSYFAKYKNPPTIEVFKVEALQLSSDVLKADIVNNLKDVILHVESDSSLDYVQDESLAFCKNQCIKNAIIESVDLLQLGNYDAIKSKIDTAMKAGSDRNIGLEYFTNIKERYNVTARTTIQTPWPVINDLLDGGIGKGELIVLVAGAGGGKSTSGINIGAHAIKQGKTVVHYTLELYEPYVAQRYDSVLTGIATANLKYNLDDVERELSKVYSSGGNLIIKFYPTKSATVNTLKAHLDKLKLQGINPDLVIVDYGDLLRPIQFNQKLHEELEMTYYDLRGMAGEYDIPVVTFSQSNRSGYEAEVITGDLIASSFAKVMIADVVISLSRKTTDKIAGTGRWHFIKNRFGPDGVTLPSKLNMSTGRIEIYEETSVKGKQTKVEMDEPTIMKKTLSNKYKELLSNDSLG